MGISTSVLQEDALCELGKGPFNNYVDKMRWAKMPVFVHAQGVKTVHAGGGWGIKKWQNALHVVVEWPLST